jgi:hypothetical protein
MRYSAAAAALAVACLAGAIAQAGGPRPILVELYTSQGCSSCPPADALLGRLTQRKGVIALSFPITYWDMFGWKDTLASEANTRRQKAYAAALWRGGVYTPQIVVDGTRDVVGSRTEEVEDAIEAAADARDAAYEAEDDRAEISLPEGLTSVTAVARVRPSGSAWSIPIDLKPTAQKLHVVIGGAPETAGKAKLDAAIWLFRLRSSATVRIGAGENRGRTATYRNVVNDIAKVGSWRGKSVTLDLPRAGPGTPAHDSLVIVVQQGGYGRVLGAAFLGQATYYAQQ